MRWFPCYLREVNLQDHPPQHSLSPYDKTLLLVHLRWAVGDYDVHANGRARPCLGAGAARTGVAESREEEE